MIRTGRAERLGWSVGLSVATLIGGMGSCTRAPDARVHAGTVTVRAQEGTALFFDLTPDGKAIIFDLLGQLWELPIEGGTARAITDAPGEGADDRQPAISPDGNWIATRSDRPGGRGIWLIARADSARRALTDSAMILGGDVGAPAWSPGGNRLAYVQGSRIVLLDVATEVRQPLTVKQLENESFDEPAWSPDGKRLLLSGPWRGGSARALLDGPPGARIWEVDVATGQARALTNEGVPARAPAYAPDGQHFAYFRADTFGGFRLVVQKTHGEARTIAADSGIEPRRARWSPDGQSLFFVARGRLRRVPVTGGASVEIPFIAELHASRARYERQAIRFPDPGDKVRARGFSGIALAPDGRNFAILALGQLWLVDSAGQSKSVATVPASAFGIAWSPDGRRVAWSAGPKEGEDIWITDVASGTNHRLTKLPGSEGRAAWSPNGTWIAFTHWPEPESSAPGSDSTRILLVRADAHEVASVDSMRDLGAIPWSELSAFASALQWLPRSDTILVYGMNGWPVASRECVEAVFVPVMGIRGPVRQFPCRPSHIALTADGSLLSIEEGVLTHRPRTSDGWGAPDWRGNDAALYPSASHNHNFLLVSSDGIRLRDEAGAERLIGWPLEFRVPAVPPLLLRNIRFVHLDSAVADTTPRDMLLQNGRIRQISPAGTLRPPPDARVLDGAGRWAMPGLIDPHSHLLDGGLAVPRAALYHGVTTMREMWHPLGEAAAYRDAIAAGVVPGARIIVSGPPIYPFPTGQSVTSDFLWIPVDSATTDRALALLVAFDAGHVKMRYVQSWSGGAAFVRRAHAYGLPVGGHCAHALSLVLAGMDTHEHLDGQCGDWEFGVHDDVVQLYRAAGVIVDPIIDRHHEAARTASDTMRMHASDVAPFMTPGLRMAALAPNVPAALARFESRAARAAAATRAMYSAGVSIIAGSDAFMYPGGVHRELEALVAAGLSPRAALVAATRNAAAALGVDRDIGRLEVGYRGDMLLLDANPIADIRNTRRIWQVIQDGRLVDREALRTEAATSAPAARRRSSR